MKQRWFLCYILFSCLLMTLNIKPVYALEDKVACGSQYIVSLVSSITGDEIETVLLIPRKSDPFKIHPFSEKQKNALQNSKLVIVHKHQKALLRKVGEQIGGDAVLVVLEQNDLLLPLNYFKAAQKLEGELSKLFPEYEMHMDEKLLELKEQASLLNGKLLAKSRELGFVDITCVVSERQQAFAKWMGLDIIGSFKDDITLTVAEKNKLIKKAKKKECWLVICNQQGQSQLFAKNWIESVEGEMLVLIDDPEPNEELGIPGWQYLLEDNVKRLVDIVVWH